MSKYEDWTDWAGDHPEQAEADLRAEARKKLEREVAALKASPLFRTPGPLHQSARKERIQALCEHEFHLGVCLICEAEDEDYEPSDAQIPGTYEIGKAAA